jgi:hypothetical protein
MKITLLVDLIQTFFHSNLLLDWKVQNMILAYSKYYCDGQFYFYESPFLLSSFYSYTQFKNAKNNRLSPKRIVENLPIDKSKLLLHVDIIQN